VKEITPKNNNGSIVLRFSVAGNRYSFNPSPGGKYGDPKAMAKAQSIASQIALDVLSGNFDYTLTRYKPNAHVGRTVADAQRDLDEARRIQSDRDLVNAVDLPDLFRQFTVFKSKSLKLNSLIDYNRIQNKLNRCPYKLAKQATEIVTWLVDDHKGKTTKGIEKQLKLINACCNWAVSTRVLKSNPFKGLKTLIPLTKITASNKRFFTIEERDLIIEAFDSSRYYKHYSPLVRFIFSTGCRPSEALALQWKHIKPPKINFVQKLTDSGVIELGTKTEERRAITMNAKIAAIVTGQRKENQALDSLLFPAPKGGFIDWHNFNNRAWQTVLESLSGIDYLTPYHMRHTFISLALRAGVDAVMISKWVGNSPATIAKYYLGDVSDIEMPDI
jgi:integrase